MVLTPVPMECVCRVQSAATSSDMMDCSGVGGRPMLQLYAVLPTILQITSRGATVVSTGARRAYMGVLLGDVRRWPVFSTLFFQ